MQRHQGVRMSKLGEFVIRVKQDARAGALLAAAGLLAAISPAHAQAPDQNWNSQHQQRVLIEDIADANDLNERVSDQLGGIKPLSDALNYSLSYGSPNVSSVQKAKNLAIAFDFQLQQASHGEHAQTDGYLVTAGTGRHVSQELRDLVEIVNAKKLELNDFTLLLIEIEKALVAGDGQSVEMLTETLAGMSDKVQEDLYNDVSVGYEYLPGSDKINRN